MDLSLYNMSGKGLIHTAMLNYFPFLTEFFFALVECQHGYGVSEHDYKRKKRTLYLGHGKLTDCAMCGPNECVATDGSGRCVSCWPGTTSDAGSSTCGKISRYTCAYAWWAIPGFPAESRYEIPWFLRDFSRDIFNLFAAEHFPGNWLYPQKH